MTLVNRQLFRRTLYLALIVPLALLAFFPWLLGYLGQRLSDVSQWERHSIEVLSVSHETEKLIVDSETGLRGFQLTGDEVFLEPLNWAATALPSHWAHLADLVHDNPDQLLRVHRSEEEYARWKAFSLLAIEQRHSSGQSDSRSFNLQGKALMDGTRKMLMDFNTHEEQLLADRKIAIGPTQLFVSRGRIAIATIIFLITAFWVRRQFRFLAESYESSLQDLTEQKESLRVTLTSIGDAVVVTTRDGNVSFMNPEAERLTGWESREAKDKALRTVFKIINEQTRHPADDPVDKVFREKRVVGLANHTLLISKSGVEWPIEDSAAPICDRDGNILGVVLVFHDATEMRRAQNVLKNYATDLEKEVRERTIELQRTINDLQAFSYSVSHDLRSPLRAMQAYAQVLLDDYGSKLDETARDYLLRLSNSSRRLDTLIQDILTYSRLGSDKHSIQPIDLDRLTREVIEEYPSLKEAASAIELKGSLASAMGHEPGLTQVLSNLLSNALKFKPKERAIRIAVSTEIKENTVVLSIADNGIGIRPEDQSRIFKMFEQVDGKAFPGTGIGLAIVKKSVEQMHGKVGVDSAVGQGSRFWVELLRPRQP